jgi:adenylate kinase
MISEMIRQGKIVPAEITVGLLKAAMDASMATRFLIDGFPRDMENVRAWEKSLGNPEFVLAFDCPEEEMERRLLKRGETSGRSDDNAATIKKRFKTFLEQTAPVLDYYRGKNLVKKVSATAAPPKVHERVVKHFGAFSEVPDIVFVLGGPGSGKGTQCSRIANEYGFVHLSAGDLLRAAIQSGSKDGALIAGMIREGKIVPQEITIRLLRAAMDARPGCRFLVDGFPRAMGQAAAFEEMVGHGKMILFFDAPDEVLTERLLKRGESSGRTDDNAEAIAKRLVTYHTQSQPVISAYTTRGLVKRIDATRTPDEIFVDVESALAQFRKQQIVLVLGQPLSGKTGLCTSLARTGAFTHIASSDLIKAEAMAGTEIGRKAADCVRSGKTIPADITVQLISKAVSASDGTKFLIDGFPRKMADADLLAEAIGQPYAVLYLDCAAAGGIDVMLERNKADAPPGGAEAAEEKLKARFDTFESETMEMVKAFEARGVLKRIEAAAKDEEGALVDAKHGGAKLAYEQAQVIFGL